MTQEEKLEEAKRLYKTANKDQRYVLEKLFPELKESEDEKIRKGLIKLVKATQSDELWCEYCMSKADVLAWLEKQGKQKPTDLEEFINELSKQFPDVSFAKLSRIAVRVAKWAKPTDEEMKELLRTEYEKGRADVIAEMQKSAWSIEDGKSLNRIVGALKCMVMDYNVDDEETLEKDISWLKSLKERL